MSRLKELRKARGFTQQDLAEMVNVSRVSISQWENEESEPKGRHLILLSEALGVSVDDILPGASKKLGLNDVKQHHPKMTGRKLPVISMIQAGNWGDIVDNFMPGDADEWRQTTAKVGKHAFMLKVVGDSMTSPYSGVSIPEGHIVTVDPDRSPVNGDIVVARWDSQESATIKKLVQDGITTYLMPLNPRYDKIEMTEDCSIVGVVVKAEFDL